MWFIQMKFILDILNVFTEFGDLFNNIISSNLLSRALDSIFIYLFVDDIFDCLPSFLALVKGAGLQVVLLLKTIAHLLAVVVLI